MKRYKPYTEIGIRRLKCIRCGKQAEEQRQICSDGNQYRPICKSCDYLLNTIVLSFMKFKNIKDILKKYKKKLYL